MRRCRAVRCSLALAVQCALVGLSLNEETVQGPTSPKELLPGPENIVHDRLQAWRKRRQDHEQAGEVYDSDLHRRGTPHFHEITSERLCTRLCTLEDLQQYKTDTDCVRGRVLETSERSNWSRTGKHVWNADEIVGYLKEYPQRAYFSRLFREGGFRVGMEIGVAGGRFSEHFLIDNAELDHWTWYMMEPFPSALKKRLKTGGGWNDVDSNVNWHFRNIGKNANKILIEKRSDDPTLLHTLRDHSFDFLYLDGDHTYETVKYELLHFYSKVRPGGVMAGHDYCNYGESPNLKCPGCDDVPRCGTYTYLKPGREGQRAASQDAVVRAVQEFMQMHLPNVTLYHTLEDFTRSSLHKDGFDYDLVITSTRNPSWYFVKPSDAMLKASWRHQEDAPIMEGTEAEVWRERDKLKSRREQEEMRGNLHEWRAGLEHWNARRHPEDASVAISFQPPKCVAESATVLPIRFLGLERGVEYLGRVDVYKGGSRLFEHEWPLGNFNGNITIPALSMAALNCPEDCMPLQPVSSGTIRVSVFDQFPGLPEGEALVSTIVKKLEIHSKPNEGWATDASEARMQHSLFPPCCLAQLFIWPAPRFKGLNNQMNQLVSTTALASLLNATVILPTIESNFNSAPGRALKRLNSFSQVASGPDGSFLMPFEWLYDVPFLRARLLNSTDYHVCLMTESEAVEVCHLDLYNTRPMPDYKAMLTPDLFPDDLSHDGQSDHLQSVRARKVWEVSQIQNVSSSSSKLRSALVRPTPFGGHKTPPGSPLISRKSYDWFQSLQETIASSLAPGSLLRDIFHREVMSRGSFNALHLRIESDLPKSWQMSLSGIISFLQAHEVSTDVPLYVAHAGSILPYRQAFAQAGYNIASKEQWAPTLMDVAKGHREVLASFEQFALFHSQMFVGTSYSTLSFYVMAGRNQLKDRPSLDYFSRAGRPCCRAGIPYAVSRATASEMFTVREVYNICLWTSSSVDDATGESAIFLQVLKEELERRGHSVFIISQERQDRDIGTANLDSDDIHLHVLDQTQYPAHLLPGYLDGNLHSKVLMRADRPIALNRDDIRQDQHPLSTVAKYCTTLLFVSEWTRHASDRFLGQIPAGVHQVVVNDAADPFNFYPPRNPRKLRGDRMRVGMSVCDNNFTLIQKLSPMLNANHFEFVLIGKVPGEFHRVFFTKGPFKLMAPMNQKHLGSFFRDHIDAYFVPSFESWGNSEVQALSSGLPLIALRDSSHSELVGQGGVFFGSEADCWNATDALRAMYHLRSNYDHYVSRVTAPKIQAVAAQYLEAAGLVG